MGQQELRSMRSRVTVVLDCGHQITAKNPPLNSKSKYVCPARCGYQVPWSNYTSHASNLTAVNPLKDAESSTSAD
jgi:hypothetical protein